MNKTIFSLIFSSAVFITSSVFAMEDTDFEGRKQGYRVALEELILEKRALTVAKYRNSHCNRNWWFSYPDLKFQHSVLSNLKNPDQIEGNLEDVKTRIMRFKLSYPLLPSLPEFSEYAIEMGLMQKKKDIKHSPEFLARKEEYRKQLHTWTLKRKAAQVILDWPNNTALNDWMTYPDPCFQLDLWMLPENSKDDIRKISRGFEKCIQDLNYEYADVSALFEFLPQFVVKQIGIPTPAQQKESFEDVLTLLTTKKLKYEIALLDDASFESTLPTLIPAFAKGVDIARDLPKDKLQESLQLNEVYIQRLKTGWSEIAELPEFSDENFRQIVLDQKTQK